MASLDCFDNTGEDELVEHCQHIARDIDLSWNRHVSAQERGDLVHRSYAVAQVEHRITHRIEDQRAFTAAHADHDFVVGELTADNLVDKTWTHAAHDSSSCASA